MPPQSVPSLPQSPQSPSSPQSPNPPFPGSDPNAPQPQGMGGSGSGGTQATGYMGPDQGPFSCSNCTSFDAQDSGCHHPEVMQDPEVPKLPDGRGQVDAQGCCNDFQSSGAQGGGGTSISLSDLLNPASTPSSPQKSSGFKGVSSKPPSKPKISTRGNPSGT